MPSRKKPADLAQFYAWLQFLCDEQLAAAQRRAKEAGMRIGLVTDLAVGVHPGGADAINLAEYLVPQSSVGAPRMTTTSRARTGPSRRGTRCAWRSLATARGARCCRPSCVTPVACAWTTSWACSACSGFRV